MLRQGNVRPLKSHCKHIHSIGDYSPEDIAKKRHLSQCEVPDCNSGTSAVWACLHDDCLFVGCAGNEFNHILHHYEENDSHCIILDLNSLRVFCYKCQNEIFLENNDPPIAGTLPPQPIKPIKVQNICKAEPDFDSDDEDINTRPRGLTGLRNLGNTCYINSAVQALSNCPPLTQFFLDCGASFKHSNRDCIAKSYSRLINDIWHKKRPSYLSPDGLVCNFKESSSAHWIFGNYNQQDSQEFLRYFMDALHEELKQPVRISEPGVSKLSQKDSYVAYTDEESSMSDMDYESCESGSASRKYSSNEDPDLGFSNLGDVQGHKVDNSGRSVAGECESKERKDLINRRVKGPEICSDSDDDGSNSVHKIIKEVVNVKKKPMELRSIISDIFDGKIVSSVQCLTCDTVSSTKETFQDLSLPIPTREQLVALHSQNTSAIQTSFNANTSTVDPNQGWIGWGWSWFKSWLWGPAVKLHDCLAAFFSADELKGDNMYSCGKCKKLRNGIKYSRVLNLPEVLCIHLKRFRNDFTKTAKISNPVSFPLETLDLSPYMHKDSRDLVTTYDLNAVICHYGSDSGSGHYTAYGFNAMNGSWYEFDDQFVTEVIPEVVLNCEAYVFFYRKTSDEMNRRRIRVIELMKRSNREPSLMQFYISKQWINKFNTFAEPGSITNSDFLCVHGGVHPMKASYVEDMCTIISQSVWEYLHDTFGGGPVCNHLFVCPTCQLEKNYLEKRQKAELEKFIKLHKEFQAVDQPTVIYAISMSWFREWESFVKAKDVMIQPPGSIDNSKVVSQKGNQPVLKTSSDYGQMSEDMWRLLFEIYGGGPQIIIKPSSSPTKIIVTHPHKPTKITDSDDHNQPDDASIPDSI